MLSDIHTSDIDTSGIDTSDVHIIPVQNCSHQNMQPPAQHSHHNPQPQQNLVSSFCYRRCRVQMTGIFRLVLLTMTEVAMRTF